MGYHFYDVQSRRVDKECKYVQVLRARVYQRFQCTNFQPNIVPSLKHNFHISTCESIEHCVENLFEVLITSNCMVHWCGIHYTRVSIVMSTRMNFECLHHRSFPSITSKTCIPQVILFLFPFGLLHFFISHLFCLNDYQRLSRATSIDEVK